jgi:hypothetical protein
MALETRCDFCGRRFTALAWNERTCFRCEADGAPNQSKLEWTEYQARLHPYLRRIGALPPLTGAAASPDATRLRPFPRGPRPGLGLTT